MMIKQIVIDIVIDFGSGLTESRRTVGPWWRYALYWGRTLNQSSTSCFVPDFEDGERKAANSLTGEVFTSFSVIITVIITLLTDY